MDQRILILEAGHPIPDERGVRGAHEITRILSSAEQNDLVFCLISGGGSALVTSPVEGITLKNIQELTSLLLACGATIQEFNTIRKHVETLKGGALARVAYPARMVTLILSDVIGDPLDVIASGMTVPDTSTFEEGYGIFQKFDILGKVPQSILTHIQSGRNFLYYFSLFVKKKIESAKEFTNKGQSPANRLY